MLKAFRKPLMVKWDARFTQVEKLLIMVKNTFL